MAFNRDRNSRPGGGGGFRPRPSFGNRPRFNDRGSVEMYQAVCDNCGKNCEVPFRPTQGKPIFCSDCFRNQKEGSDSRRPERTNFNSRQSEERNQRPQRPEQSSSFDEQFKALNTKLDSILRILESVSEEVVEEIDQPAEEVAAAKKKKPSKKAN